MEYTKGDWKTGFDMGDLVVYQNDAPEFKGICTMVKTPEYEANANLIVAAVNACKKLNPDNPMAVAEGITGLYEACLYAQNVLPNSTLLAKAIAKVEITS